MVYGIIFGCIVLSLLFIYMLLQAFENNLEFVSMTFPEFPKEVGKLSVFFISDIHRRKINSTMIEQVKGKVDIVIIAGDLTEKGVPLSRVQENVIILRKIAPVVFTWGNNDYEVNQEKFQELLKKSGVILLKNEIFYMNHNNIALIGLDDVTTQEVPSLESLLEDIEPSSFQILISHNPSVMDMLPDNHRLSLVLSGHTHGGQIRILGFGRYKKGGIEEKKGCKLLISNGYGTTLIPLRLGAKPETHLITLKPR